VAVEHDIYSSDSSLIVGSGVKIVYFRFWETPVHCFILIQIIIIVPGAGYHREEDTQFSDSVLHQT
jgi:hypothetical protein